MAASSQIHTQVVGKAPNGLHCSSGIMAGLKGGAYNFIHAAKGENKRYLHLILTQSAQKSLTEYLNDPIHRSKPLVLSNKEGGIKVPKGRDSNSVYKFLEPKPSDSGYECIVEHSKCINSKGGISATLRLQADYDDSYANTRKSVENAIALNGKNCTKVLKTSTSVVQHRPTRPTLVAPPRKESANLSSSHYSNQNGQKSTSPLNGKGTVNRTSPTNPPSRIPPPPPFANKKPHPALLRKPIQSRIIHLLAVRPMKKIEIIQRIHSDGVKELDKKKLSSVIQSVSTLKENSYYLLKHLFSEVQPDWPFYTEEEKALLKKNRSSISPSQPQVTSSPNTVPAVLPSKPNTPPVSEHGVPHHKDRRWDKRQKDATAEESEPKRRRKNDNGHRSSSSRSVESLNGENSVSPLSQNEYPFTPINTPTNSQTISQRPSIDNGHSGHAKNPSQGRNIQSVDFKSPVFGSEEEAKQFTQLYPTIQTWDERYRYKSHFYNMYDEYYELYQVLIYHKERYKVKEQMVFDALGTPKYEVLKEEIYKDAEELFKTFLPKRDRYGQLHLVLDHIREEIETFDKKGEDIHLASLKNE